MSVFGFLIVRQDFHIQSLQNDASPKQLVFLYVGTCMTLGFFAAKYLILKYPEYLQTSILVFNCVGFIGPHLAFMTNHKGHFYAFIPSIYLYHFYLATLTPSKRHFTTVIFTLTVVAHVSIAMYRLGGIDPELIVSGLMSILFSDLGLKTNQTRLSQMYQMILDNTRLVKEKQKVVQQFPHPVLILPEDIYGPSSCYSNNQFEEKITALNQQIQQLENVNVTIEKKSCLEKNHQETLTLLEYLEKHQEYNSDETTEAKNHVIIQCRQISDDNSSNREDMINQRFERERLVNRNFSIKSLRIEWKGTPSVMHVFIDTTDIINLEQAKSRIKLQKIMFASTSHEFRTPLNAIINSFNFIKSSFEDLIKILTKKLPEDVFQSRRINENINSIFKFSKTGATSSTLLLALVEDFLNLSKIDNGTFVVSYEFFSIPALLRDVHSLFSMQCEQRKVDLITECDDDLRFCEIKTDRNRVRQVLLNLVSNSTKFTFSGFIKIKAALTKTLDGLNFLELRVEDSGTGIKKEDQQNLFKQFGTLEENRDMNPNGCGLGLTISKKYVERLGGEIRMKSVYGKGTDMTFTVLTRDIKHINSIAPASLQLDYPPLSEPLRNHRLLDFQVNNEYFPFEAKINKCKIYDYNESKF